MNKFFSVLALSVFFITWAIPFPLFADDNSRGEGSGGATHDRPKKVENEIGSTTVDHQKKSVLEYKDPGEAKTSGYKNEGRVGASQVREAEKRIIKRRTDRSRHNVRRREGS